MNPKLFISFLLHLQIFKNFPISFLYWLSKFNSIMVRDYAQYHFSTSKFIETYFFSPVHCLTWWPFHMHLKQMWMLLFLSTVFYKCQLVQFGWLIILSKSLYPYQCSFYCSINYGERHSELPTILEGLSVSTVCSVSFSFQ